MWHVRLANAEICYLTLTYIVQMEHFDIYSSISAVQIIRHFNSPLSLSLSLASTLSLLLLNRYKGHLKFICSGY